MKIVLDTNVLVSGLLSADGPCGQIVGLVVEGILQPCMDERILLEYETVLSRPELKLDSDNVAAILEVIRAAGETLTPLPLGADLPDVADLTFLEVAAASDAPLITGNTRHFPAHARETVRVLNPREFVDLLRKGR